MHYVITCRISGRAMRVNDTDDRYLICVSKAHAMRVIKWLGLTDVRCREASEEEIAYGLIDTVKA